MFCAEIMQINQTLDTSSLPPALVRGDTHDQEGRTIFKESCWTAPDGRDSETLMYDTERKRFVLCVRVNQKHMKSKAYYWLTAAQAIEWMLNRHAGPHTLEAAKPLLAQANMQSELAQNFNVALN
jgi:hypothetical protein